MARPKAPQDRYVVVDGVKRDFGTIKKDELYELYESDHTQVAGKFIATSDAYLRDDGIWCIDSLPYMELKILEDRVQKAKNCVKDAETEVKNAKATLKNVEADLKAFKQKHV